MKNVLSHPISVAMIGFTLTLPGVLLLSLLMLGIEPPLGPLEPLLNNPNPDQPDIIGSAVALTLILLLPAVAFTVNVSLIRRAVRVQGNLFAHPLNLALAIVSLALILTFVGGFIVDQYPCWVGFPNCD